MVAGGGGDNSDMIDDVASRTDTAHIHTTAGRGWIRDRQVHLARGYHSGLLLPTCPPAHLPSCSCCCCCCWLSWLLAVGWYWQIYRAYSRLLRVCVYAYTYVHITRTCTYSKNVRACVCCVLVSRAGLLRLPSSSLFLTFGRFFYPSLNAHTQAQGCHKAG